MRDILEKSNVSEILTPNLVQKGMLYHYLKEPEGNVYNVQLAFTIEGVFEVDIFKKAVEITQSHHEVLASVFNWEKINKPLHVILKTCPIEIRYEDISAKLEKKKYVNNFLQNDQEERFDLTQLPIRISIIKTDKKSYVLSLSNHHILYDGWSTGIFLRDIFQNYDHLINKQEITSEPKPLLKHLLKEIQQVNTREESQKFWASHLNGYELHAFFPSATDKQNTPTGIGKCTYSVSHSRLKAFAAKHKVTPASVMYAAYGVLLQKYFNKSDVVFGTTVSNRPTNVKGADRVMGNFINTLPLRCADIDELSLSEWVKQVSQTLISREPHHSSSYFDIKRLVEINPSENLFDSVVVIENYPLEEEKINVSKDFELKLKSVYENTGIPLMVSVFFKEDLEIEFSFQENQIQQDVVQNFGQYFIQILNKILDEEPGAIKSLSLLSEKDNRQILKEFNDTTKDYRKADTIISIFEASCKAFPRKIALKMGKESLNYAQLQELTNKIASWLQTHGGVEKGDLVGIMLEREMYMIPAILGIMKAGGVYLPIDPKNPVARKNKIIENAGLTKILTRGRYVSEDLSEQVSILDIGASEKIIHTQSIYPKNVDLSGQDLAYVIYTSGTTGNPKGVMIEHHSVVNRISWMQDQYPIGEQDVLLQKTPITFDVSVWELFWWSFYGASLALLEPEGEKDPDKIVKATEQYGVTTLHFVPSMLRVFLSSLAQSKDHDKLKGLRQIFASGEALKLEDTRSFAQHLHIPNSTRLINLYGPTEATVDVSYYECTFRDDETQIPIGKPIDNIRLYVLDRNNQPSLAGVPGELHIAGVGLARGYLNREELTATKFISPESLEEEIIYKTGDLVKWLPDGNLLYLGRIDDQVKIRGYRIELAEIEGELALHPEIENVAVVVKDKAGSKILVAYYVASQEVESLKPFLSRNLPEYMVPSYFVRLDKMPVNANGKLARKRLPEPNIQVGGASRPVKGEVQEKIAHIWTELLDLKNIGADINFFDIGGDSLKLISLNTKLNKQFEQKIQITDLFKYPTIASFARFIEEGIDPEISTIASSKEQGSEGGKQIKNEDAHTSDIAIVGMAGRFPGARNIREFWENLKNGKESISREEIEPEDATIYAKGILQDYENFDAPFFGYSASEAKLMDPQVRIFHECVWEVLENAGYDPYRYEGEIGLYAGASPNPIYTFSTADNKQEDWIEKWQELTLADKDFLCSRISYLLNLRGPSVNISTACSTSLVAVDTACNELLLDKCDMAIAGGVSITLHDNDGYRYAKGMILSPDGRCRAFDKQAAGTIGGNGAGVVLLKKLSKAIADGDHIHAIIKGTASNNDGKDKVGFTAPSVSGQSRAIRQALAKAGVTSTSISYVETHGTGTSLGDPIEIAALSEAFSTSDKQFCAIGSVKTNIGHLDAAAGIAGLIKAVLSLKHKFLPASLHFEEPNPNIDFENSPFYVNKSAKPWEVNTYPRRAGISSFGIGGTNAHVILEETPEKKEKAAQEDTPQLMLISAKTKAALSRNLNNLSNHLEHTTDTLADISYTLNTGRAEFPYRKSFVATNKEELRELLSAQKKSSAKKLSAGEKKIAFMFSGQGAQYPNMFKDLYEEELFFRKEVDRCFDIVFERFQIDLKSIVFPRKNAASQTLINHTANTQPLLFIMEYALARLMMHWGVRPDVMIGHSVGEFAAACISGIFSLEDALFLVVKRGELIQKLPKGSMLSIAISEDELLSILEKEKGISLAAVNSSESCVVSGTEEAIQRFEAVLDKSKYKHRLLEVSHAFHSYMMDPILDEFEHLLHTVRINPPAVNYISNFTGKLAEPDEICTTSYWVRHLRQTVNFAQGIHYILSDISTECIEIGPGRVLSSLVRSHDLYNENHSVTHLGRHPKKQVGDRFHLLSAMGELWSRGLSLNWSNFFQPDSVKRIPLPSYAFDAVKIPTRKPMDIALGDVSGSLSRNNNVANWFYVPVWKMAPLIPLPEIHTPGTTLMFSSEDEFSRNLIGQFKQNNDRCIEVKIGEEFRKINPQAYCVNPGSEKDFEALYKHISEDKEELRRIVYLWSLDTNSPENSNSHTCNQYIDALVYVFRVAHKHVGLRNVEFTVITNDLYSLWENEKPSLGKTSVLGIQKVLAQEYPGLTTAHLDISLSEAIEERTGEDIYSEINAHEAEKIVAYRKGQRYLRGYDKVSRKYLPLPGTQLVQKGSVYLITGGLGSLGFHLAKYLQENYQAHLILAGRSTLPARKAWKDYLSSSEADSTVTLKIKRLKALEESDNSVVYIDANVSDQTSFSKALKKAENTLGPVTGVIHAAGILGIDAQVPIHELKSEDFHHHFTSKVYGLQTLKNIFENRPLEFCVLSSSLSTILGGVGFAAYAAGNLYMNHFVNYHRSKSKLKNWVSVNLDGLNLQGENGAGINEKEIQRVFEGILGLKHVPELIVSVANLNNRIEQNIQMFSSLDSPENSFESRIELEEFEEESLSTTEKTIILLWREFFGNSEIGVEDDFFELGGDSLKALIVLGRIYKEYGLELSVSDLFSHSTIQKLAKIIDAQLKVSKSESDEEAIVYAKIPKAQVQESYELSSIQKRLYFMYEFDKNTIAYNMPLFLRLAGKLDLIKLENTIKKLIARHENLRTCFENQRGQTRLRILPDFDFKLEHFPQGDPKELCIQKFVRPFDLSSGPLLRAGVVQESEERYLLMLDMHHISTDAVSKGVLIRDFMDLYEGKALPELEIQFKDYVNWEWSNKPNSISSKEFWLEEYAVLPEVIDLPFDYTRPLISNFDGKTYTFELNEQDTQGLKSLAHTSGVTMFMLLMSLYKVLLSKLSKQEDLVVGTVTSGRNHPDLENMIGMFVKTLPVRSMLNKTLSFSEYLSRLKDKTLACFEHQSFSYEELVDELDIVRDTSRNPLFDTMFMYMNVAQTDLRLKELSITPYEHELNIAKMDLALEAMEVGDKLAMKFEYSTGLFKPESIHRFATYFQQIVQEILKNPSIHIGEIDILPPEERVQILTKFNETAFDFPMDQTVLDLFEKQVDTNPGHPALLFRGEEISYQTLDKHANQMGHYLLSKGVRKNSLVAIMHDDPILMLTGILGIMKTGAAYVPMDSGYPASRVAYCLKDANVSFFLRSSEGNENSEWEDKVEQIFLNKDRDKITKMPENRPQAKRLPSDLMYVIYTSGSTGEPKGVLVEHKSVVNLISGQQKYYGMLPSDRVLSFCSYAFDASVEVVFTTLTAGATLSLTSKEDLLDTKYIQEQMISDKVTQIHVPVSLQRNIASASYPFLKRVITGGEACPADLPRLWGTGITFFNEYGPTEATVTSIQYVCTEKCELEGTLAIGKPLYNIQAYILDEEQRPLPIGIRGDLYIGGKGISRGYLNQPELTFEKFIPNPLKEGERIYKTGDQAKWLPDGNIMFLGRDDKQVKIRGFRIELGEIETAVLRYPSVKQAVVLAKGEAHQDLVAYIISDSKLDANQLRSFLADKIPAFMIPAFFVQMDAFPQTTNGKLDLKVFPEPVVEEVTEAAKPKNLVQKQLLGIWSEVLNIDSSRIGISTSFFDIGGNSLKLMEVSNKINEIFDQEISVTDLFRFTTIHAIAGFLDKTQSKKQLGLTSEEKEQITQNEIDQMNAAFDLIAQMEE